MGVITPNAGLLLTLVLLSFFAFTIICAPGWMMANYDVDTSAWNVTENLLVKGIFQYIGIAYFIPGAACSITFRTGTDDQKGTLCAINGVVWLILAIVSLAAIPSWTALGPAASGGYFNAGLSFVVAVVNFLGASKPTIKCVNLKHPLYWGYLGSIIIYVFYSFAMAFFAEGIMQSYGCDLSGMPKGVAENLFKFTLGPWYLYIALIFIAQLIVPGPLATYVIARFVCFYNFAVFLINCVQANNWTSLNVVGFTNSTLNGKAPYGTFDKFISGQLFNAFLYFFFWVLFYVGLARLDGLLKDAVEKELGAAPAKKAKEAEDEEEEEEEAAEPAPAPAAAAPAVEPLVAPLVPLGTSSTLLPSYSMVAAPQTAFGTGLQYAAPTTAYPTTTAYASPMATGYSAMPQYTYAAAAPATTAYAPTTFATAA